VDKAERVLKFVRERKRPVLAKDVAKQFALAQSTAATYLRKLHEAGYLTREQIRGQVVWAKKDGAPVAVPVEVVVKREPEPQPEVIAVQPSRPAPVEQPKVIWPTSTFQTSYPHVRGYDD
jgi:predicted transcriptional regulator